MPTPSNGKKCQKNDGKETNNGEQSEWPNEEKKTTQVKRPYVEINNKRAQIKFALTRSMLFTIVPSLWTLATHTPANWLNWQHHATHSHTQFTTQCNGPKMVSFFCWCCCCCCCCCVKQQWNRHIQSHQIPFTVSPWKIFRESNATIHFFCLSHLLLVFFFCNFLVSFSWFFIPGAYIIILSGCHLQIEHKIIRFSSSSLTLDQHAHGGRMSEKK